MNGRLVIENFDVCPTFLSSVFGKKKGVAGNNVKAPRLQGLIEKKKRFGKM